jgi:membrane fusion protein, copper/silver efflux system
MKNILYSLLLAALAVASLGSWPGPTVTDRTTGPLANAGHVHGSAAGATLAAPAAGAGGLEVSAEAQRIVGVRVVPVEQAARRHTLRLLGRVAPDETRLYRINAGIDGTIREVSPVTTGSLVAKDQVLATFTSPGALSIIQLFILNSAGAERVRQRAAQGSVEGEGVPLANANLRQRVDQLRNIGMSTLQMEEISRAHEVPETIRILAPAAGFVLSRSVTPGLKFDRGAEFYRLADLSRVWIVADVFEQEAQYLRPGVRAQVSLVGGRTTLAATVAAVLPQFDPATRTLKVRLEADNPGHAARPDMFVDVTVPVTLPATIAVPADAVLDSGIAQTVFVERAAGLFEPRRVETGARFGDQVVIVKGLSPGERVVVAGTFLLDSETRMRLPATGVAAAAVAGPAPTGHQHGTHGGAGRGQAVQAAAGHDQAGHGQ